MSDYTYILYGREYCKACGDSLVPKEQRKFSHKCEPSDLYARSMERYRMLESLYNAVQEDTTAYPDSSLASIMEEARELLGKERE